MATHTSPKVTYSLVAVGGVALIALALWWLLDINLYWLWLVAINLVTFFLFRFDKGRAQTPDAGRVPEVVLLGCTLIGGFVGAGAGMYMRPHHKTKKNAFVLTLIVSTALHLFLIWRYIF